MLSVLKTRFIIVSAIVISHTSVIAQEIAFTPRVEAGLLFLNSQFSDKSYGEEKTWFDVSKAMAIVQFGGKLQFRGFYVDASLQDSRSGSDNPNNESEYENDREPENDTDPHNQFLSHDGVNSYVNQTADIERSDYSIQFGYQFPSLISVFMGYKFQETDINETLPLNPELGLGDRADDTWDINIVSQGLFVGVKYQLPIASERHALELNTSLGFFENTYEHDYLGSFGETQIPFDFDFETNIVDFGVGAVYTHKWKENLDINVSGQLNYFSFDELLTEQNTGAEFDIAAEELNFQLTVGLQYRF